jgi:hypothetical protein
MFANTAVEHAFGRGETFCQSPIIADKQHWVGRINVGVQLSRAAVGYDGGGGMCVGVRVYLGATWSIIPGVGILLRIVAQYINACSKQIRVMPGGGDQQHRVQTSVSYTYVRTGSMAWISGFQRSTSSFYPAQRDHIG